MQKIIILSVVSMFLSCFYGCNKPDNNNQNQNKDNKQSDRCG